MQRIFLSTYISLYIYIYIHIHIYTHTYIYIHIYVHIICHLSKKNIKIPQWTYMGRSMWRRSPLKNTLSADAAFPSELLRRSLLSLASLRRLCRILQLVKPVGAWICWRWCWVFTCFHPIAGQPVTFSMAEQRVCHVHWIALSERKKLKLKLKPFCFQVCHVVLLKLHADSTAPHCGVVRVTCSCSILGSGWWCSLISCFLMILYIL